MPSTGEAIDQIRRWGEARDWRGWDPYDALNSPLAPALTLGTRTGRRVLTQTVKLSPLNLRPALRIPPALNAKAIGLVASAYARLAAARDDPQAREQARGRLRWLVGASTADVGLGWGYHFDVQTRFFAYRRGTPNVIATSFVAHALLDGRQLLGEEEWGDHAQRACAYMLERLLDETGERPYFRYLDREQELVHNANVLAASVLARTAILTGQGELAGPARSAVETTLSSQRPDGSWPYADETGRDWVDSFHTGYVLESLELCRPLVEGVAEPLERGLDHWERTCFLADGTPAYYAGGAGPEDAHTYAQAIETWLAVASWRSEARALAERTARLLVERLLTDDGHVAFQRRRLWTNRVPFVRWTTAPAFRALARLELAGKERS